MPTYFSFPVSVLYEEKTSYFLALFYALALAHVVKAAQVQIQAHKSAGFEQGDYLGVYLT